MEREQPTLGEQELEVLRFVTEHAPVAARDVAEQFGGEHGLARTTVLTMMERLRKGAPGRTSVLQAWGQVKLRAGRSGVADLG